MSVLRPCAVCHKFRLCTGFTRPFWPVRCRPAEGARRLPKRTAEAGRLGQASPTQSQTGDGNERRPQVAGRKKNTANGLVRRGRPLTSQTAFGGQLPYKGSLGRPAVGINHSLFEYNGRLLRDTSHKSRATDSFLGLRCGVPPRQTHEMNAVRRWPVAVRKKTAPTGAFCTSRGSLEAMLFF